MVLIRNWNFRNRWRGNFSRLKVRTTSSSFALCCKFWPQPCIYNIQPATITTWTLVIWNSPRSKAVLCIHFPTGQNSHRISSNSFVSSNMDSPKHRYWTWRTLLICTLISTGQIGFGYPASIISTTLGQPSFLKYMNLVTPEGELKPGADGLTGAMSGVFQVSVLKD